MDTKKLRQKILDLAIHGKLVPQDPNDEPASVLLERINPDFTPYDNGHSEKLPQGWQIASMQTLCNLIDGEKQGGIERANLDVKYLRGERDAKTLISGKYITANSLLILVDGENSGEVFRTPIDGYQGSTFKQLLINGNMNEEYVLQVINLHRKILKENKVGSAIPHLNKKLFKAIEVPVPPLSEQQRIVMEIEKWFALIDQIEQSKSDLQTTIKQTKSKILDLAIHGKLVPQDPNDEPAIELLKRINPDFTPCDNGHYPFEIPNGWQWCTINDISEVITGSTPSKNNIEYYGGNFPFYKPTDLGMGRHVMKASEYLTEKGKSVSRIIPPKSIAICCIGSIGKTGYIEVEGTTNQQINTIVPKRNLLNSVYGYYTCISDYFVNKLINSSSAITISIINKSKLQSVIFPLPPLAEQQRIVQKIEELFSSLDDIQKALEV